MFNCSRRNVNCFRVEWCTIQLMGFIRKGEGTRANIVAGIRHSRRSWVVAPWKFESWKIVTHILYCSTYIHPRLKSFVKLFQTIPSDSVGGNNHNIRWDVVVSINKTRLDRYRTRYETRFDYNVYKRTLDYKII